MFSLTITTESIEELYNAVSRLSGKATAIISKIEESEEKKPRKNAKATKADEALVDPDSSLDKKLEELATAAKTTKPAAISIADGPIDYDEVRDVTLSLARNKDKGGKTKLMEILGGFNAKSALELKKDDYAEYVGKVKAALA